MILGIKNQNSNRKRNKFLKYFPFSPYKHMNLISVNSGISKLMLEDFNQLFYLTNKVLLNYLYAHWHTYCLWFSMAALVPEWKTGYISCSTDCKPLEAKNNYLLSIFLQKLAIPPLNHSFSLSHWVASQGVCTLSPRIKYL